MMAPAPFSRAKWTVSVSKGITSTWSRWETASRKNPTRVSRSNIGPFVRLSATATTIRSKSRRPRSTRST